MPTTPTAESPLRPSTRAAKPARHRRRSLVRWIKRILLGGIAAGIVTAIVLAWLPKPVVVDVAQVHRVSLETEIAEDGKTRVRDRYVVAAPISGELLRVELDPGTPVSAGDALATIVPPSPQLLDARSRDEATARLAMALAHERTAATTIARAAAARDSALRDAARARQLLDHAAITAVEGERAALAAELATRDLASAEAQRAAAVAEVSAARAALGGGGKTGGTNAIVTAPANGRILRVLRDSAGPIATGTPLLEIGDPSILEVVIDVLSSDAARIAPGMLVEIDRWGGDGLLRARVTLVEPAAFTRVSALGVEEQRVRVIATLDAPPATLGDGFGVATRIITWRGENVLVVPASAVFRDRGQWSVFVVEGERARMRPVTIQHRGRLEIEVAGLSEGTTVILHPGDNVHEGAKVVAR